MKVGDVVYHKSNRDMILVVSEVIDNSAIGCTWWNNWSRKFDQRVFDAEELLPAESKKAGGKDDR